MQVRPFTTRSSPTLLLAWFALQSCASNTPTPPAASTTQPLTEQQYASVLDDAALVLDVRTSEEYAQGHVENARNLSVEELEARLAEVDEVLAGDKGKKVVTYCKSGKRAAQAKMLLERHGYTNVVNGGGYDALR